MTSLFRDGNATWEGASQGDIKALERLAGGSLPMFYEWFLRRAGARFDRNAYAAIDFSAKRILATYESGEATPQEGYLLVGYNDFVHNHVFYDLTAPTRDDCLVGKMAFCDDDIFPTFETFREMLAWGEFAVARLETMEVQCEGRFSSPGGDTRNILDQLMSSLGFRQPLVCGPKCGIYDRNDVALTCTGVLDISSSIMTFEMGGGDFGSLRRILGQIAHSGIDVTIQEWTPPVQAR